MIREPAVNHCNFSQGTPKICVSVSGTSLEEALWEIREIKVAPVDIIEWRTDYFNEDLLSSLRKIKEEAGETPLLVTLRTKSEGGCKDCTPQDYMSRISDVIQSGRADLVDIELSLGDEGVQKLTNLARKKGVITLVSKHFFKHTPSKEELMALFAKMEDLGADLPKIAAMPQEFSDVLTLMSATTETAKTNGPLVAISMGVLGRVSRFSGKEMGSALTFASGKIASAPGQINPKLMYEILNAK